MEKVIMKEVKRQGELALPLILANFLIFTIQLMSVISVGHINHEKLAGASMAISIVNAIGFSVLMGVSSALDTLCGQSFGAKQHNMVGLHMQRAMIIIVLVSIPLAIILAFSGRILVLLDQDPDISMAAQTYIHYMIPSLFAYGLLQCIFKFLQAQNIVLPIMLSSGITALFHGVSCWTFTYKTSLGYRGAAVSVSAAYWFNLVLLMIYVGLSPLCKETWSGFSKEAFNGLIGFLKLGIPSTFMVCLQNWQFELLLILSGLLANPKLQTSLMSISQNISSLVYTIPIGVSAAVSTRVSNELGAENPRAAKLAILTAASTVITEGLIVGLAMIAGRNIWGHAYSNETQVVNAIASMMPWIALSHCIDGLQCVLLGTIRGCGRQKIGAFVCLCSYYMVGIPASILIGFVFNKKVKGLWIGNICAIVVQNVVLLVITVFTNWEEQVMKARERLQTDEFPLEVNGPKSTTNIFMYVHASKYSMSISNNFVE